MIQCSTGFLLISLVVNRCIPGRNDVTKVRVEPRLRDQNRRKNNACYLSATLQTISQDAVKTKPMKFFVNCSVLNDSAFFSEFNRFQKNLLQSILKAWITEAFFAKQILRIGNMGSRHVWKLLFMMSVFNQGKIKTISQKM